MLANAQICHMTPSSCIWCVWQWSPNGTAVWFEDLMQNFPYDSSQILWANTECGNKKKKDKKKRQWTKRYTKALQRIYVKLNP